MTTASRIEEARIEAVQDPLITLDAVSKSFARRGERSRVEVLRQVSLTIDERSFTTILGPSGCGKTTLLRLMNGLIAPDRGEVRVAGARPAPGPDIGFVFQSFRLLPWRTVRNNVGFVLEVSGVPAHERLERTDQVLASVGLSRFADSYPGELSGGMKQRAALARALVGEPRILLMDEPFASLDAQTRELMQAELTRVWIGRPCAVVFVTHSVDEAILLGDQVILMAARPGRVAEVVKVDLPYPRTSDSIRSNPIYNELRDYLWSRIRTMVLSDPESDFYGRGI
ncbi:ABC transporter ATP-binding protein [Microvirga sp. M2]|uniref:ABC transporter ATP-binding protein n=1 Tax=Microvirga sp. M2 TaxID=3073270 RepID=UPI0039C21473